MKDLNKKLNNISTTLLKAFLAGLAISLGGILFYLSLYLFKDNIFINSKILGSILFSIGLIIICKFKLNLFTGKIGYLLTSKKDERNNLSKFSYYSLIYIGNFIGVFLIGSIISIFINNFEIFKDIKEIIKNVYLSKQFNYQNINDYIIYLYKGIFCGFLVYIAIYFYNNLNNKLFKVIGIVIPITLFVLAGYHHCIANMFFFFSYFKFSLNNFISLLITIISNSIGSILLHYLTLKLN
ncbi:MAG: formate/nitrite transporter family protein [Bacillales bacterium]